MKKPEPSEIDAWADAATALQGLHLLPARRTAVIDVFTLLTEMSQRVDAVLLPDEVEPAPVYRP